MEDAIKLIECPRDAWQALPAVIPVEVKADYLKKLAEHGFRHIDAVSFVSPAAVPQMADSEHVLDALGRLDDVEVIGIVVNDRGAERAVQSGAVQTLGFPISISPRFLRQNQNQTLEESLAALGSISELADKAGMNVVVYVSMAFGNPYGEPWQVTRVTGACERLISSGIRQISLADTVGVASASRVTDTIAAVIGMHRDCEVGVHLHAKPPEAADKIRAAYLAGCRRFDGAIGGLGGCPFAQDALVGNVPTETLIEVLKEQGAVLPELRPLDGLFRASAEIADRYGTGALPSATLS